MNFLTYFCAQNSRKKYSGQLIFFFEINYKIDHLTTNATSCYNCNASAQNCSNCFKKYFWNYLTDKKYSLYQRENVQVNIIFTDRLSFRSNLILFKVSYHKTRHFIKHSQSVSVVITQNDLSHMLSFRDIITWNFQF